MSPSHFHRDRMPSIADVLARLSLDYGKQNTSGYVQTRCPIHGEQRPSLSVHLERGNWRCFACGAHGGDALELYRQARGLSFVQAADELGLWDA